MTIGLPYPRNRIPQPARAESTAIAIEHIGYPAATVQ